MKIEIPQISLDSDLADLIVELEKLRNKIIEGTTHPSVFYQVKNIFHTLESIGSARIEGNNTTVADYIETKISDQSPDPAESIREIINVERAMSFVEEYMMDYAADEARIDKALISEIHKIVVEGLSVGHEGDRTPGSYRGGSVSITGSSHTPPDALLVDELMEGLISFVNEQHRPKYDLIKAAIAHHRFVWIHPFANGNGRVVRVLTYAMLLRTILVQGQQRIINPTAVFCFDRKRYYDLLAIADLGTNEGMIEWCEYVLTGLRDEIKKIDMLSDYQYFKDEILKPALQHSLQHRYISELEHKILKRTIDSPTQTIAAGDVKDLFPGKSSSEITRQLRKLIDQRKLKPVAEGARKYVISFSNNYIYRSVIYVLGNKGFLQP